MEAGHDLLGVAQHAHLAVQNGLAPAPIQAPPGHVNVRTATPVIRTVSRALHQLVEILDTFRLIDDSVHIHVEETGVHAR